MTYIPTMHMLGKFIYTYTIFYSGFQINKNILNRVKMKPGTAPKLWVNYFVKFYIEE